MKKSLASGIGGLNIHGFERGLSPRIWKMGWRPCLQASLDTPSPQDTAVPDDAPVGLQMQLQVGAHPVRCTVC